MPVTFDVERDGVIVATGLTEQKLDETGLTASTTYTYRVRARDEFGLSEWSDPFDVTTDDPEPTGVTFSEDFNYSDGQLSTRTSGNWTTAAGNASNVLAIDETEGNIVSNQGVLSGASQLTAVIPVLDDVTGNYFVQADLFQSGFGSTTPWIAVMARWSGGVGSATGVGLRIRLTGASSMITELFTIDGTTINVLDSSANDLTVTGLAMDGTIRLELTGNDFVGKVDGAAVVSGTTSHASSNTEIAVLANRTTDPTNGHRVDDFSTAPIE